MKKINKLIHFLASQAKYLYLIGMTIDEANHIVSEFRRNFPMILNENNAHGLIVTIENDEPILELRVHEKLLKKILTSDVLMPPNFTYFYENKEGQIKTRVKEATLPKASMNEVTEKTVQSFKAKAGITIKGEDSGNFVGTNGWNFLLTHLTRYLKKE